MRYLTFLLCLTSIQAFDLVPVTIMSDPAEAWIAVEAAPSGRTPAVLKLSPGQYRLQVKAVGFETWDQEITVLPGQTATVKAELKPRVKTELSKRGKAWPPVVSTDGSPASTQAPIAEALREWKPAEEAPPAAAPAAAEPE